MEMARVFSSYMNGCRDHLLIKYTKLNLLYGDKDPAIYAE